jgi:hypothetical protein
MPIEATREIAKLRDEKFRLNEGLRLSLTHSMPDTAAEYKAKIKQVNEQIAAVEKDAALVMLAA